MTQPLVSIIVRTCQRPEILRTALDSIRKQTYPNIQAIIVEDGANAAENLLKTEYSDLNYIYEATGNKVGRCRAGNRAMELAMGEYFNFLDDDDILMPEHVECLINVLVGKECLAAYSVAEERQIIVKSREPYVYKLKRTTIRFHQEFNRMLLYTFNYIPIQCIMFHRSLFETMGGLDETLDNLEDWDLWVRYSTKTNYIYVDKVTSGYYVPYKNEHKKERSSEMRNYLVPLREKFKTYKVEVDVGSINKEMNYVIREYKNRGLVRYLRMFFRAVFYGER